MPRAAGWGRAAAVYLLAAVAITFPLAFQLTTRIGALQGPGDPYLNLWILGWGLRAWTTDPASVLSGRVFDANIFFPAENTLAYSDHFLLQALALSPLYWFTGNPVVCYNVLLIASIAASGLAMHQFLRAVTGSERGALIGGLAWACWPYRTAHLLHIQLQALYFLPLALLCLHRVVARRRAVDAVALAVVTALQCAASVYNGLMTLVMLIVASIVLATTTGQWRSRRLWARLVGAAALALALCLPLLLPYARSQQLEGFGRTLYEAANHSASVQAYSQVPPSNLLYGATGVLAPRPPAPGSRDRTHVEHQLFPGLVLVGLALVGAWRHRRSDARPLVCSSVALAAAGLMLSFGPDGYRAGYAWLHDTVYGFQAVRAPARFAVIAVFGLATLAALGMRSLAGEPAPAADVAPTAGAERRVPPTRRRGGTVVTAALVAVLLLEYVNVPLPLASAPALTTAVGRWLAQEPTPGAVLYLPLAIDLENTPFMVQSLEHGRPIVNGYSGQRPAFYSALVDSLSDLPSPTAFAALRDFDVRFVASPLPLAGAGHERSPLVERARLEGGTIYELRWTPAAIAALGDDAAPPPPPAGPVPFLAGERASYDVFWDNGPVNLAAGRATLSVLDGSGGARWTLETRAETADWVSTFFQARDRLITTTDDDLLPIEHRREIREGRREVDRVYRYDREARTVQTGEMTLPLGAPAARDALSALYYVRTLPLAPGAVISVPLNEAGTPLVLQVSVAEPELVDAMGERVRAVRLEPRIMRRIERRRPIALTLWLSDDARRLPLRAVVDAGFGRIRLELRDYRREGASPPER